MVRHADGSRQPYGEREHEHQASHVPGNLVARAFGFGKIEYFELADPAEATVPEVKF